MNSFVYGQAIDYIYEKMGNSSEYHLRFNYVQLYRDNVRLPRSWSLRANNLL